ncbi:inorganic phosphate transporter [Ahniella affigens]|uniref:inorganic phosphate transporter n=1 Tax=Ahniella affigens TaxID=2021234 RepID=UPI001F0C8A19|nr:inorganic phosphate transporter [Ahniella affigens]
MTVALILLIAVIITALIFEYINGFHDTANSIATVVATKVLTPSQAVLMAAGMNLLGALWGTAVAKTVASGLIDTGVAQVTSQVLICALLGGIAWNLITWWWGLPSSSSHALVGGLCGAAVGSVDSWSAIIVSQPADPWYTGKGVLWKVVVPMFTSPMAGFVLGLVIMGILFFVISRLNMSTGFLGWISRPRWINALFGKAQIVSAATMGFAHGSNDAQKTMGIIALALVAATSAGTLDNVPDWMSFLRLESADGGKDMVIPMWIALTCAVVMAMGTAAGGWRIIKTLGHKMVKLHPIHGFAAETASATMILTASSLGIPVSTTHNISAAIMGVGCSKRWNAIKWTVVERMLWAWVLTIPATGAIAYALVKAMHALGWA